MRAGAALRDARRIDGCGYECIGNDDRHGQRVEHDGFCVPILVRVEAQSSHTKTWDRRIWEAANVPPACSTCTPECQRPRQAPTGTYTASILAFTGCLDLRGQECTCSDPGNGNCEQFFGSPQGDPIDISASFELPTDTTVELVLD